MKIVFAVILALIISDPKEIAKVNTLKKEAESAYLAGDYELALSKYTILSDSLGIDDPAIKLNLAHSHYHLGDTAGAKSRYNQLATAPSNKLKSVAFQQLGVMSKDAGKLEEALQQLKSAIKADPTNQEARYNYEVVKKLLEEQKKQEQNQDQQDQEQENKDGEDEQEKKDQEKKDGDQGDQEKKDGEQEKSEEEKKNEEQQNQEQKEGEEEQQEKSQEQMTKEKLKEMGISEEKARQLLEAMRQSEIKYLQHQKRKPTKRPPSGKPDW
ncbi:hypothetical protein [Ekhidna sp.]|uniref:hypothetical protein n=1 Tax=Ekhidna sp. TaxID=2608089 RepID=UPI0032EF8905